jgi:hypothetical protein
MPATPTPITHVQHLKLDADIDNTVDALEDFLRKFDAVRAVTDRMGVTVEGIHELAVEATDLIGNHQPAIEWSARLHEILLTLVRGGLATDAVGRLIGVSRIDVIRRLCRNNITDPEAQQRCQAEEMAHLGIRKSEIAKATGMKYDGLVNWLKLIGLFVREQPVNTQTVPGRERALELMALGLQNSEVVAHLAAEGVCPCPNRKAVATWRHRFYQEAVA